VSGRVSPMMWDDGGWGTGEWILMTVVMIVFWVGLIALVVWLVRSVGANQNAVQTPATSTAKADQMLAERFARGEIDEDEYKRRRDLLHAG
jgi:putative membrane protein